MNLKITKVIVIKNKDNRLNKIWVVTDLPQILQLSDEYVEEHPYSLFGIIAPDMKYEDIVANFKGVPIEVVNRPIDTPYGMWEVVQIHSRNKE